MFNFALIAILILLNGFFAAAEMAFIAARPSRLQLLADEGNKRAQLALAQKDKSADFLAMVQVGITLVATLASALGGASVARQIAPYLEGLFGSFAPQVALTLIVIAITYASLVIGELVPKQIALYSPEKFIIGIIGPLRWFQRLTWLPVRFLDSSAQLILRLLGYDGEISEEMSADEVRHIIDSAASDGEISVTEQQLINKVFAYSASVVADVMTPHPAVIILQQEDTVAHAATIARESGFSRLPVISGDDLDSAVGYLHVKDLLGQDTNATIHSFVRHANYLPDSLALPRAFSQLTQAETHIAFVVDEFGGITGLITLEDLIEEIVGEIEDEYGELLNTPSQTDENNWDVDGATSLHDVEQMIGQSLPEDTHYTTIGGLMIARLGRLPHLNDQINIGDLALRVTDIDGRRIAQVTIRRQA